MIISLVTTAAENSFQRRRLLLVACASELLNKDLKEPFFILSPSSIAAKRALDDKAMHRTSSAELVRVVAH